MPQKLIDVEDAAAQLGVGRARVRKLCSSGTLTATKVGNQWAIEAKSVRVLAGKYATKRASIKPRGFDFRQTMIQVRNEIRLGFVPELLRLGDIANDQAGVVSELRRRVKYKRYPADHLSVIEVPKDEVTHRPGVWLNPIDHLLYHGAVLRIAPAIDKALSTAVFSSRVNRTDSRYLTRPYAKQYAAWQRATKKKLTAEGYKFMLATDIVGYYEQVDVDLLYDLVAPFDHGNLSWPVISTMLRKWSADIRGLPQGPDASAILGNLYLKPLDDLLDGRPGVAHLRYMDDIRIFTFDRAELIRAATEMQRLLRTRHLDIKTDKTLIMDAAGAIASLVDSDKTIADYLMKTDQAKARTHIRRMVRSAVSKTEGPDRRTVEFGLRRLRRLGDAKLLTLVLERLDRLAPSGHVIAEFVSHFPNRPTVAKEIGDFLVDANRNLWPHYEMWLLHALAESSVPLHPLVMHRCREIARDPGRPWWLRAAAIDALSTDPTDVNNAKAINDGIRAGIDIPFFRQVAALLLQRGLSTKTLQEELGKGGVEAERLLRYTKSSPSPPQRWLGL